MLLVKECLLIVSIFRKPMFAEQMYIDGNVQAIADPPGGRDSPIKMTGVLVGKFRKQNYLKRYQNLVLWAWP